MFRLAVVRFMHAGESLQFSNLMTVSYSSELDVMLTFRFIRCQEI